MSKVITFRDKIVQTIRTNVPELHEVDWYDGLFDEEDINDWALKTPCAFVALRRAPGSHHSTGELNISLRALVVVVVSDQRVPRDADGQAWEIIEKIALLANFNSFGEANAGPATNVRFERLQDPELRREGVCVGIVEWSSELMIGTNRSIERHFYRDPATGELILNTPDTLVTADADVQMADGRTDSETVTIYPTGDM